MPSRTPGGGGTNPAASKRRPADGGGVRAALRRHAGLEEGGTNQWSGLHAFPCIDGRPRRPALRPDRLAGVCTAWPRRASRGGDNATLACPEQPPATGRLPDRRAVARRTGPDRESATSSAARNSSRKWRPRASTTTCTTSWTSTSATASANTSSGACSTRRSIGSCCGTGSMSPGAVAGGVLQERSLAWAVARPGRPDPRRHARRCQVCSARLGSPPNMPLSWSPSTAANPS